MLARFPRQVLRSRDFLPQNPRLMPFSAALALNGCLAAGIDHACDRLADRHDDDDESGYGHGGNRSAARPPRTGSRLPLVIVAPSLLALAVSTGLQVMTAMFEEDVTRLCGPDGKHNPDRAGYRHGGEAGSVTLGGRRLAVTRPRVGRPCLLSGQFTTPADEPAGTRLPAAGARQRRNG